MRTYKRSIETLNPKSKREQFFCYSEVLELFVIIQPSSIRMPLANIFDLTKENVGSLINYYKHFIKFFPFNNNERRPKVLTEEQIHLLKEEIKQKEKQYLPMTKSDILVYIYENFNKILTKKWVSRLIKEELSIIDAIPLNEDRTDITIEQIRNYFKELREACNGVHPDLILNTDEIGKWMTH